MRNQETNLSKEKGKNCSRITCPYHGWEYTLSGRLHQAKRVKGIKVMGVSVVVAHMFQNFSAKDYSLKKIHLSQWEKWLFVAFGTDIQK